MFAYRALQTEAARQMYAKLLDGLSLRRKLIPVRGEPGQINAALKAVLTDNPRLFWFEGKWALDGGGVAPLYTLDDEAIRSAQPEIDACTRALARLKSEPPYIRARGAYDFLLQRADYGMTRTGGQTMYDALVLRHAVCKGLSKAYQFLLSGLDVRSTLAEGTIDGISKHVWNIVELDNHYYNVDISMGYEQFSYLFEPGSDKYRCFMVTDDYISRTHTPRGSRLKCDHEFREV